MSRSSALRASRRELTPNDPKEKQRPDTELEASGIEVDPSQPRPERGSHKSAQGIALGSQGIALGRLSVLGDAINQLMDRVMNLARDFDA
jgi:hypothetical protein